MNLPPEFLLKIAKATSPPEQGLGKMSIIVRQPYSHLEKELLKTFKGQEDVRVLVDKRKGERRLISDSVAVDRRRSDRRSPKEELVEVVLSV
jgi:hypothetical protein